MPKSKNIGNSTITDIHKTGKVSLIILAKNEGNKIGLLLNSTNSNI